jgi:hypothetical protein
MNNEHESTYTLLVRSEEKGRSILETVLYALFSLSAIVSIWQFAQLPNRLPIDGLTSRPYDRPKQSVSTVVLEPRLTMNERSFIVQASWLNRK